MQRLCNAVGVWDSVDAYWCENAWLTGISVTGVSNITAKETIKNVFDVVAMTTPYLGAGDVTSVATVFADIAFTVLNPTVPLLETLAQTLDVLLTLPSRTLGGHYGAGPTLLTSWETLVSAVSLALPPDETLSFASDTVAVDSFGPACTSAVDGYTWRHAASGDSMTVPASALAGCNTTLEFIRYRHAGLFQSRPASLQLDQVLAGETLTGLGPSDVVVLTPVVSVRVARAGRGFDEWHDLGSDRLTYHFGFTADVSRVMSVLVVQCAYWDGARARWSNDGCVVMAIEDQGASCACSHLTSFAVVASRTVLTEESEAEDDDTARTKSPILYVGLGALVVAVLVLVLVLVLHSELRTLARLTLVQAALWALVAEAVFVLGITETESASTCRAIAGTLLFALLATVLGTLAYAAAALLWALRAASGEKESRRPLAYAAVVTHGVPLILVLATTGSSSSSFGGTLTCWISGGVAIVLPTVAVVVGTLYVLVLAASLMSVGARSRRATTGSRESQLLTTIAQHQGKSAILVVLLGATWVLGLAAAVDLALLLQVLFVIASVVLAVFLIVAYVLRDAETMACLRGKPHTR